MTELFDRKDVFSVLNTEEATNYIDCKGYFGNTLKELQDAIKNNMLGTLAQVHPNACKPFVLGAVYSLFLPIDKIKKPEKKWRAFANATELLQHIKLLEPIVLRWKDNTSSIYGNPICTCITAVDLGHTTTILLGTRSQLTCQECFDILEIQKGVDWLPFGVEDE